MRNEIRKVLKSKNGQTSVELILLIGGILVITIISGTYIYKINSEINNQFSQTMKQGRDFLLNKI